MKTPSLTLNRVNATQNYIILSGGRQSANFFCSLLLCCCEPSVLKFNIFQLLEEMTFSDESKL